MKILQIVTYVSPDGAYGGPVRVAINQAKALTELGHEVVVAAAAGGFESSLPAEFDGFPVRLFPARRIVPKSGFAGLTSPALLGWLAQAIRGAEVVHVHLARDLVTIPSAALTVLLKKPLIVQTHGMIDHSNNVFAGPLDYILTRPILRYASGVHYLTDREREDLTGVAGGDIKLMHLPNGVVVPEFRAIEQVEGPQQEPEVLYLARMHSRKRPIQVVQAALTLENQFPQTKFALVGPDEGEADTIRAIIHDGKAVRKGMWSGPISPEKTLDRMSSASVYVLPSIHEPFPMSVLEAMSLGLPVVITESCGLAPLVRKHEAGVVCGHGQDDFTSAVKRLLEDSNLRLAMGARGRDVVQKHYSMESVGATLINSYKKATRDSRLK